MAAFDRYAKKRYSWSPDPPLYSPFRPGVCIPGGFHEEDDDAVAIMTTMITMMIMMMAACPATSSGSIAKVNSLAEIGQANAGGQQM